MEAPQQLMLESTQQDRNGIEQNVGSKMPAVPTGPEEISGLSAVNAASHDQTANRSKKHAKKKPRGGNDTNEYVQIPEGLKDFVRRVRVEPKKESCNEDKNSVHLSKVGKASQLKISEDGLSVTGFKGYRSIRASHGIHEGSWYCEASIVHAGATGHARIGWCTSKAELQAPVGFDAHGFCYRDLEGSKVHQGLREPFGESYGEGDVIGLFLCMPSGGRSIESRSQDVVRYKGNLYYVTQQEPKPEPLKGTVMAFSKNGVFQGTAFSDFPEGTYYPAVSLYTMPEQTEGITVRMNFGPNFSYPPPQVPECPPAKAICELATPVDPPPQALPISQY